MPNSKTFLYLLHEKTSSRPLPTPSTRQPTYSPYVQLECHELVDSKSSQKQTVATTKNRSSFAGSVYLRCSDSASVASTSSISSRIRSARTAAATLLADWPSHRHAVWPTCRVQRRRRAAGQTTPTALPAASLSAVITCTGPAGPRPANADGPARRVMRRRPAAMTSTHSDVQTNAPTSSDKVRSRRAAECHPARWKMSDDLFLLLLLLF